MNRSVRARPVLLQRVVGLAGGIGKALVALKGGKTRENVLVWIGRHALLGNLVEPGGDERLFDGQHVAPRRPRVSHLALPQRAAAKPFATLPETVGFQVRFLRQLLS